MDEATLANKIKILEFVNKTIDYKTKDNQNSFLFNYSKKLQSEISDILSVLANKVK